MSADLPAIDRDLEVPVTLSLQLALEDAAAGEATQQNVICTRILRLLPHRRLVASADVQGRACVIKLFVGKDAAILVTGAGRSSSACADTSGGTVPHRNSLAPIGCPSPAVPDVAPGDARQRRQCR